MEQQIQSQLQKTRDDIMELQIGHKNLENTFKNLEDKLIKLTETVERSITNNADRLTKLEIFKNNIFWVIGSAIFTALIFGGEKAFPIIEKLIPVLAKLGGQ